MFSGDGGVFVFGDSAFYGSAAGAHRALVIGMATTRDDEGLLARVSGRRSVRRSVMRRYSARWAVRALNRPIVGTAATPTGRGYLVGRVRRWHLLVRRRALLRIDRQHPAEPADRRHDADSHGPRLLVRRRRRRHLHLRRRPLLRLGDGPSSQPIVGMATTATGHGYWISTIRRQGVRVRRRPLIPVRPTSRSAVADHGHRATPTGTGYWVAAGDGGLFNFGDAVLQLVRAVDAASDHPRRQPLNRQKRPPRHCEGRSSSYASEVR